MTGPWFIESAAHLQRRERAWADERRRLRPRLEASAPRRAAQSIARRGVRGPLRLAAGMLGR